MLIRRSSTRGVSLIELVIVLAILAIVMARGMPMYSQYMQDLAIRGAAEATLAGLQLAKSEAARSNRPVEFVILPDADTAWVTRLATDPAPATDFARASVAEALSVVATSLNGASRATFDGLGALRANIDGSASIAALRFTSASSPATSRALCVTVSNVGAIRMCDPNVPTTDPRSCGVPLPAGC